MKSVHIEAIGLAAPGLNSWQSSQGVLAGVNAYGFAPLDRYKPQMLPANERRRATDLIRLAFRVCEEVANVSAVKTDQLAAVFASCGGDNHIIDQICRVFDGPERAVSPTQFHNSVHNSAAGYWSIASGSRAPSVSLCGYGATFAIGLMEAVTLTTVEQLATLLVVYDSLPPAPLQRECPIQAPFGAALLLTQTISEKTIASLTVELGTSHVQESMAQNTALEAVRLGNPAARAIPLLEMIAKGEAGCVTLNLPGKQHLILNLLPRIAKTHSSQ